MTERYKLIQEKVTHQVPFLLSTSIQEGTGNRIMEKDRDPSHVPWYLPSPYWVFLLL